MPFTRCVLVNIPFVFLGRRLPEQAGRFPGLYPGDLKCPGRMDACARSPLSRLAPHNLTLKESDFHDEIVCFY
jgi:hypothetical protein